MTSLPYTVFSVAWEAWNKANNWFLVCLELAIDSNTFAYKVQGKSSVAYIISLK